jgi:4-amino-4-deoxy-L-arabinose transferase-like glycosyltransferase
MESGLSGLLHRRSRAFLLLILLLALVARLGFWFVVVGFDTTGGGDEPDYHRLASSLAAGEGLTSPLGEPTAARPPLYPILLGALYKLTGPDPDVGRALQVLLGVVIVLLVHQLALRFFSPTTALLAAALAAVNPGLVYMSALLMSENLYVILLLLTLIVLAPEFRRSEERERMGRPTARMATAGLLVGLASLARPTGFVIAIILAGAMLFFAIESAGRRLRKAAVFMALAVAVVAPWSVRNYVQLGDFVTFTTHGGITFYESNNILNYEVPEFRGIVVLPRKAVPEWDKLKDLPETEYDETAWKMGMDFVRTHPRQFATMAWWKFARFWRVRSGLGIEGAAGPAGAAGGAAVGPGGSGGGPGGGAPASLLSRVDVFALYWIPVLPLFVLGLIVTARRFREFLPVYSVVLAHVLTALVFHGSLRARMPIEPVISLFAAGAFTWIVTRIAGRRLGPAPSQR